MTAHPGPVARDDATAAFFDGTARGTLLLRRCPGGHWERPPAKRCGACGATELQWVASSGRARLVSWAVVPAAGGEVSIPAIVETEEGPWWWTAIVAVEPGALAEGMPLEVRFERPGDGEAVPVFAPARA